MSKNTDNILDPVVHVGGVIEIPSKPKPKKKAAPRSSTSAKPNKPTKSSAKVNKAKAPISSKAKPSNVSREEPQEDIKGQELADTINKVIGECETLKPGALKEARTYLIKLGELKKRVEEIYSTELRAVDGNADELSDLRQMRAAVNINHRLLSGIVASFDRLKSLSDYQLITED